MINYIVPNENTSSHWPYFNTENHNVLDLGCGRWYTTNQNELSPIYFGKNSKLVVGVDSNSTDIDFYNQLFLDNQKYIFKHMIINHVNQIKKLIMEYDITAIKCDIEGYESHLLDLNKDDLLNIGEFAIEFHTEELKKQFEIKLKEWGFTIKAIASFLNTPKNLGILFSTKNYE